MPGTPRASPLRSGAARRVVAEDGRPGNSLEYGVRRGRAHRRDDLRSWKHRDSGARNETRSLRLRREASLARQDRSGGAERARISAAGGGKPAAARRARATVRDSREQRSHEGIAPADRIDGTNERTRPNLRRERNRKGTGSSGFAFQQIAKFH